MTHNDADHTMQDPTWQLWDEFSLLGELGRAEQAAARTMQVVRELGLQPAQVQRIGGAIAETVQKAEQREDPTSSPSPVHVRLWVSGASTDARHYPGPDAERHQQQTRQGWGFFLIQKSGDPPLSAAHRAIPVIELFLYQERHPSRDKDGR